MPNRLEKSESPYLRQHADNPVDWWPWCDEAFAEARRRDVPVLVSIGYSTCHWCHVMAHESFEDEATAAAMNAAFICIKVDREEHPEVDEIYMDAVQALTGHGGWPLNAFTDHQGRPFYALTYLPRERWGQLCGELARLFREDRPRIHQVATDVAAHLVQRPPTPGSLDETVWEALDGALGATWDGEHPGFAHGTQRAPKFPSSQLLPLLLASRRADWIALAEATLEAMQDSGLHDRVGGGFHRYSVTRDWRLPHFEKMLYDNALLIGAYAVAGRQLDRSDFLRTAVNAGDYLLRDLRVTVGGVFRGYASAEDADDPVGEGSFYAWSPDDLRAALGAEAETLIADWAIVAGEREVGPHGHLDPVLTHIPQPRAAGIAGRDADTQRRRASWEPHLPALRAIRDRRPRPGRDDKVLTDLNGLALEAFAALARHAEPSDRPRFAEAARELADVILARRGSDGLERLPGKTAYITDYGHLASGLTAAYAALGDPALVDATIAVVDEAAARLRAPDGGFYTTPAGRDDLFRRSRELVDNAYPAGQNALAVALVRLAGITGDPRFGAVADGIIASSADIARRAPSATTTLLAAWRSHQRGPRTAVITGPPDAALAEAIRAATDPDLLIVDAVAAGDRTWACLEGRRDLPTSQILVCLGERCLAPWTSAGLVADGLVTSVSME